MRESIVMPGNCKKPTTRPLARQDTYADELRAVTATADTWDDWLQHAARLTADMLKTSGVLISEARSPSQPFSLVGLTFPAEGISDAYQHAMRELAAKALAAEGLVFDDPCVLAAIVLPRRDAPCVFLVVLENDHDSHAAVVVWLPLVAACAELWTYRRETPARETPVKLISQKPSFWSRPKSLIMLIVVALAVMILPVPYDVACDCELQPVTRRYLAAPFEGTLERALVEVGDTVAEGQLLARMDGKEVRWELAGNAAEYERAAKERDAHLADQKFGEAQLAKLQMERLGLTTRLLEHRSENLEIRSPIEGIVVSGELKRAEGVRLSLGQTLFEIAPLDRMIVEVEIPESELAHVPANSEAVIRLEAFPDQRLEGSLKRICPRAELRNKQQVFIGEIALPNNDGQLRPGMRGRAHLAAGQATLGWRLFHRAWNKWQLW